MALDSKTKDTVREAIADIVGESDFLDNVIERIEDNFDDNEVPDEVRDDISDWLDTLSVDIRQKRALK